MKSMDYRNGGTTLGLRSHQCFAHYGPSLVAILLLLFLAASCTQAPQPPVLATVGDRQITVEDLTREVERRRAARRPVPDKEALLQEMVSLEALRQRAEAAGLLNDPQVQHELTTLLVSRLRERELAPKQDAVSVSSEEIRAEYERDLARYTRPAKTRLALLALPADAQMSPAARAELRTRLNDARRKALASPAPSDFGTLAVDYSDDQASRYRGGDIGWLDAGKFSSRWPREVLEAGFALDHHAVSEVIETPAGFYLVMKTDSRPGSTVPLPEVEQTLRKSLSAAKRRALETAFREETVRAAGAVVDARALAAVDIRLPALAAAKAPDSQPPALPVAAGPSRD
jgi:parvulin-like peptidyl-prolyl isomerase